MSDPKSVARSKVARERMRHKRDRANSIKEQHMQFLQECYGKVYSPPALFGARERPCAAADGLPWQVQGSDHAAQDEGEQRESPRPCRLSNDSADLVAEMAPVTSDRRAVSDKNATRNYCTVS